MSQLSSTERRPLTEQDAVHFLEAVSIQFTEAPQYYNRFLDIMMDYKEQRIDTLGTIEAVVDFLHPFPELLLRWNTFLSESWHVQSTPDPKDPYVSNINIKTPDGDIVLRKRAHNDLYPLIPIKEEMMPISVLLYDVKEHYAEKPEVYQKLIKTIQPRPDNPIDKYQLIEEIAGVIPDTPHLIQRFRLELGIETLESS